MLCWRLVVICLAATLAVACATTPPGGPTTGSTSASSAPAAPILGVSGTSLTLDGNPWWPIGINAYQLGTDWSINAGCGAEVDLDAYFGSLQPHSVTRFNAYSSLAVNKHTGQLDFTALDAVFKAAERHGQLLIAVLTADEGACENAYFKDHGWYVDGWRTDISHGVPMTFADWLDTAVKRWRHSPSLAGWTAVGEPEPSECAGNVCHWPDRRCPADSARVLRAFFDATGARIHELDPGAVIFSGHAGGGQCGAQGHEFEMVGASPGLDVLEYHYYEDDDYLPGDVFDGLERRVAQARTLNKPLMVSEIGMEAGSCRPLTSRAKVLLDAVDHMRRLGAAGAGFWAFVPDPRLDECSLDIGPADPLLASVGAAR